MLLKKKPLCAQGRPCAHRLVQSLVQGLGQSLVQRPGSLVQGLVQSLVQGLPEKRAHKGLHKAKIEVLPCVPTIVCRQYLVQPCAGFF